MIEIYNQQLDNQYTPPNAPPGKQVGCIFLLLALAFAWAFLINQCT